MTKKYITVGDVTLEIPNKDFPTSWQAVNAGIKLLHRRIAELENTLDRRQVRDGHRRRYVWHKPDAIGRRFGG